MVENNLPLCAWIELGKGHAIPFTKKMSGKNAKRQSSGGDKLMPQYVRQCILFCNCLGSGLNKNVAPAPSGKTRPLIFYAFGAGIHAFIETRP